MEKQIRNGDVFLRKVEPVVNATPASIPEPTVLAYGEVTGHKHQILDAEVERYEHDNRAYVLLKDAGVLTHEEHGQAKLEPGWYELIIERDYDPTLYQRRVTD